MTCAQCTPDDNGWEGVTQYVAEQHLQRHRVHGFPPRFYGVCGLCDQGVPLAHAGHFSRLGGQWWCDTCDSPYCELA